MRYLSDVNLRAVLSVLLDRAGGSVEIGNEELYEAMMSRDGRHDGFGVHETSSGIRLTKRS